MGQHYYGWVRQEKDDRDWKYTVPSRITANLQPSASLKVSCPKPNDQGQLGSCHKRDTEVLTNDGWKLFSEVESIDKLATVDPITSVLTFERPTKLIKYHYTGDLVIGQHQNLDFAVTPDHNMLVRKWNESARTLSKTYQLVPASEIGWYAGLMNGVVYKGTEESSDVYVIKSVPNHKHKKYRTDKLVPMSTWLQFLGVYLAEGTMVRCKRKARALVTSTGCLENEKTTEKLKVQLAASKDREKTFIRKVLTDLGVNFHEQADRFQINNKQIYNELESLGLRNVKAPHKFVPDFVFKQSGEQIKNLLLGHFMGDGSEQDGHVSHYTSSHQLAADLQRLIFLSGGWSGIGVREPRSSVMKDGREIHGKYPEYRISNWKSLNLSVDRKQNITDEHYDGDVFCATMPIHHTLVTRRNGKILISGNCGPNATSHLIQYDQKVESKIVIPPSRLFVYWCTRHLQNTVNQDSGVNNRTMLKAYNQYGFCHETAWVYDTTKYTVEPPSSRFLMAAPNRIKNYAALAQTLDQMKGSIASGLPFLFGFDVFKGFESPQAMQTGIVPMPGAHDTPIGGHDIAFVGYDDTKMASNWPGPGAFLFENSWGANYGVEGFGWLPYAYAVDPNKAGDFWVINAVPGGKPPNPVITTQLS